MSGQIPPSLPSVATVFHPQLIVYSRKGSLYYDAAVNACFSLMKKKMLLLNLYRFKRTINDKTVDLMVVVCY